MSYNITPRQYGFQNKGMVSVPKQVMVRYKRELRGRQLLYSVITVVKRAERGMCVHVSVVVGEWKHFPGYKCLLASNDLFEQPRKMGREKEKGHYLGIVEK